MDKISRVGPPEALSISDGLYSFVVKLNEPPAGHWIYAFKLNKAAGDVDPERVVFDPERGLLFVSEERLVPDRVKQDTPGVLEHAEGWRISSQPTKVESNRQGQRSPETASDQSSPAASRQSPIRPVSGLGSRDSRPSATRPRAARATSGRR